MTVLRNRTCTPGQALRIVKRRRSLLLVPVLTCTAIGSLAWQRFGEAGPDWTMTAGGVLVGLTAGLAMVAIGEYRNPTFRSGADVAAALSLPVLSVIPEMEVGMRTSEPRFLSRTWLRILLVSLTALFVWHLQL
jgi:hypothetical protein